MPIYLYTGNAIFEKQTIEQKYFGGIAQFLKDHESQLANETLFEDDELFVLHTMGADETIIDFFTSKGLVYNEASQSSEDFAIFDRYSGHLWSVDWLEDNEMYCYHKLCKPEQKGKADAMINIAVDILSAAFEKGENPFAPIKS